MNDDDEKLQQDLLDLQQAAASISAVLWTGELLPEGEIRTLYISSVAEKVLGRPVEYFLDNPLEAWSRIIHPDDRTADEKMIQAARKGVTSFELEYRVIWPSGEIRWVRDSIRIRSQKDGKIYFHGLATDITEGLKAQKALQEANEQLQFTIMELASRNRDASLMNEMGDVLQSCLNLPEIYEAIQVYSQKLLPGHSGAVLVLNREQNQVEALSHWGKSLSSQLSFPAGDCWALRRGRFYSFIDGSSGPPCGHLKSKIPRFSICIPMVAQGETLGLFYLECDHPAPFDHCQQVALMLAERSALATATMNLQENSRIQSIRDPCTGLYNRRFLDENLKREVLRAGLNHLPLVVAKIEIDRFNLFNDQFSKEAGDAYLRFFSSWLGAKIRAEDILCRYGGEEFAILYPGISVEDAFPRLNEIRASAQKLAVNFQGRLLGGLTISIGLAAYPQDGADGPNLLFMADKSLSIAKQAGRNRVVYAGG